MENYKKITIDAYNKGAINFSEKFKLFTDLKRRYEFKQFLNLLNGKKIIDLGCGSGINSLYFYNNGLDVVSVDLSIEMIKLCKKKGLNAMVMDIEDLEFDNEIFDGIWAVTSLLHIPKSKLKRVIKKLSLILKDNGIIFISIKEGSGEYIIRDEKLGLNRFFAFWKEDEIIKLFSDYFELIESKKVSFKNRKFLQMFFKKKS